MNRKKNTSELRRSWLVQRLKRPYLGDSPLGKDPLFAFGGGYKNGGLSDNAMDFLREVFAFDYMGSAEFEWGAVPEALQTIAKSAKTLVASSFSIPLSEVTPHWRDTSPAPDGQATVYVLCRRDWVADVEARIRQWAGEERSDLKECLELSGSLRPFNKWDGETAGWLELDNGFMFFTDHDMWVQTAHLFGVKTQPATAQSARGA